MACDEEGISRQGPLAGHDSIVHEIVVLEVKKKKRKKGKRKGRKKEESRVAISGGAYHVTRNIPAPERLKSQEPHFSAKKLNPPSHCRRKVYQSVCVDVGSCCGIPHSACDVEDASALGGSVSALASAFFSISLIILFRSDL